MDSELHLRSRRNFTAACAVMFLALFFNNAPTPLYPIWQAEFGLGPAATTAVHSAYPIGTVLGLLFGGKIADQIGRRSVLLAASSLGLIGALLALYNETFVPLLLARLINGIATGLISGPITAAIIELEPRGCNARASWMTALMTTGSTSIGTFVATIIVTKASTVGAALTIPFVIQAMLYAAAALFVISIPETLPRVWRKTLSDVDFMPRSVRIPASNRLEFAFAISAAFIVWALTGLWLGLGPALAVSALGPGRCSMVERLQR